jgi:tRNA-specific 2-thiouridylase
MYYTIGQRQGLGIGGLKDYPEEPWFAAAKDLDRNVLIAVQGQHPLLYSNWLHAGDIFWISGEAPELPLRCKAKVRYRQADQDCTVEAAAEGGYRVVFDQPQRAVTPGQSVVFYVDDLCLGGGVIETTSRHSIAGSAKEH